MEMMHSRWPSDRLASSTPPQRAQARIVVARCDPAPRLTASEASFPREAVYALGVPIHRSRALVLLFLVCLAGCVTRGGRGGGGGGGDDDDSVPTQEVTGQVTLEGLEVFMLDWWFCAPGGVEMACADYELVFEVAHSGDDELVALDRITVEGGDMEFVTNEPCTEVPWTVPLDTALPTTITIAYEGEQGFPTMYHRCGNSAVLFTDPIPGDAPKGGDLTVDVRIEGTEFVHRASASAQIQFAGPMR